MKWWDCKLHVVFYCVIWKGDCEATIYFNLTADQRLPGVNKMKTYQLRRLTKNTKMK